MYIFTWIDKNLRKDSLTAYSRVGAEDLYTILFEKVKAKGLKCIHAETGREVVFINNKMVCM